ncbi:replication terminator protein [Jeotgalibacillus proteolyticus]|uniref:replication terminator protein n=1 Tax=Jeotgalibacillus proteolyticus TaxID=2082395 RepID=UPI0014314986|nr:replication terminator protein [Jeotgalibacillus proteolyticus]
MKNIIDLNTFAEGALAERFNREMQRAMENIADPNTKPELKRKVTMTVTLEGDEKREVISTDIQVKTILAPARNVIGTLILDRTENGKVTGAELKSGIKGQTYINDDGDLADDRGEVIDFKNKKSKSN